MLFYSDHNLDLALHGLTDVGARLHTSALKVTLNEPRQKRRGLNRTIHCFDTSGNPHRWSGGGSTPSSGVTGMQGASSVGGTGVQGASSVGGSIGISMRGRRGHKNSLPIFVRFVRSVC